jgi:ABC-type glutathione transport system ATPase component
MALLEVYDLKKSFSGKRDRIDALNGVTFQLEEGKCLGLVGESGCGKSTAAAIIARLIREDSGKVIFLGREITSGRLRPVGQELRMVFQDPAGSFDPRDTVLNGVAQGLGPHFGKGTEKNRLACEAMEQVGLKQSYAVRKFSELSGGECQRAAIARAIICRPKLLICDEATSALDTLVQAQIARLLKELAGETGMSMLFITHDLPLASSICDDVAVMSEGRIVESGRTADILERPSQPETKKLLESVRSLETER